MIKIYACEKRHEDIWIKLNREFMDSEIQDDASWNDTQNEPDSVFQNTFREALENPQLIILLLFEEDGEVVGFANLMTIYSVWAHGKALILDDLFIRREHQGKGLGKEFMQYLTGYAKDKGYKRLQFQSEFTNPGALAFYTKIGFTPVDMHFYVKHL